MFQFRRINPGAWKILHSFLFPSSPFSAPPPPPPLPHFCPSAPPPPPTPPPPPPSSSHFSHHGEGEGSGTGCSCRFFAIFFTSWDSLRRNEDFLFLVSPICVFSPFETPDEWVGEVTMGGEFVSRYIPQHAARRLLDPVLCEEELKLWHSGNFLLGRKMN